MAKKKSNKQENNSIVLTVSVCANMAMILFILGGVVSVSHDQSTIKTYNDYSQELSEEIVILQDVIQKQNLEEVKNSYERIRQLWAGYELFIISNQKVLELYHFETDELQNSIDNYIYSIEVYIDGMEEIQNGTI